MGTPLDFESVYTRYIRELIQFKARQVTRVRGFRESDHEDVVQELSTYLWSRIHLFDPTRASLSTFADRVIASAVAMMIRDRQRKKRRPRCSVSSLEQCHRSAEGEVLSLREMIGRADLNRRTGGRTESTEATALMAAVREAIQRLPPELQKACHVLIAANPTFAARKLGMSRRQMQKVIHEIRKHFEQAGLGESPSKSGQPPRNRHK